MEEVAGLLVGAAFHRPGAGVRVRAHRADVRDVDGAAHPSHLRGQRANREPRRLRQLRPAPRRRAIPAGPVEPPRAHDRLRRRHDAVRHAVGPAAREGRDGGGFLPLGLPLPDGGLVHRLRHGVEVAPLARYRRPRGDRPQPAVHHVRAAGAAVAVVVRPRPVQHGGDGAARRVAARRLCDGALPRRLPGDLGGSARGGPGGRRQRVAHLPARALPATVPDRAVGADHHRAHVHEDVRPDLRHRRAEQLRGRRARHADVGAAVLPAQRTRRRGERHDPAADRRAGGHPVPHLHEPHREGGR